MLPQVRRTDVQFQSANRCKWFSWSNI